MKLINATVLDRKSGAAQWRDLCVDALSWECFPIVNGPPIDGSGFSAATGRYTAYVIGGSMAWSRKTHLRTYRKLSRTLC
jgi:hypothetical protein